MKKTLTALAALAAFGSAFAQSAPTVAVYGKVDIGLKQTTVTGGIDQGLVPGASNYEGSRYGIKGGSDLGMGLKASYQLEGGFNPADGTNTPGQIFNRVSKIALSGGFGSVQAGMDWTPYDNAFNDAMEYNGFSAMNNAFCKGVHCDTGSTGNGSAAASLQYTTPDMGGFNAVIMYAPGQNKTATQDASSYTGLGLNYARGPVAVNFAYEDSKPVGNGDKTNAWIAAASYDLGMAKVFLALEQADAGKAGKDNGMSLGVSLPVSKQTTVGLGFATETTSVNGKSDGKAEGFGLQAVYALTPAAALYVGYSSTDTTVAGATAKSTATKFATGLRYNF